MSTAQHKGRIVSTGSDRTYVRKQPGISLPSDSMTREEIKGLSGKVTTYKYSELVGSTE